MTIQATDRLLFEGVPCRLKTELHLRADPRVSKVSDDEARASCSAYFTTACWRNFVAQWQIVDGRMYLTHVAGKYRLADGGPLAADWVSRTLYLEEEEVITDFWDEDYNAGMPRQFIVEIERGLVTTHTYARRTKNAV
jgi:hypothetical protein